jgi:nickel/cobalt exporter
MKRYRPWLFAVLIIAVIVGGILASAVRPGSHEVGTATAVGAEQPSVTKDRVAWGPARDGTWLPPSIAPAMGGSWWRAFIDMQHRLQSRLVGAIRGLKADDPALASALLAGIAFLYGIMHAVGPGHGKAVISSYVLADGATLRRGILLSFVAAFVQALTAIAMVWGAMIVLKGTGADVRQWLQRFEAASGAMIVLAGIWLAARHLRRRLSDGVPALRTADAVSHVGHHDSHDETCDCGHAHMPSPGQVEAVRSWSEAVAIVLAIGTRPCTGAILLLVFAIAQGLFWAGVGGTFAMALGTAITVSALACLTVGAREAVARMATAAWAARLHDIAVLAGALLLGVLGLSVFVDAMGPLRPF